MRPQKKPKYKLDAKKFEALHEQAEKKEKDWTESEFYQEMLREKSKSAHR